MKFLKWPATGQWRQFFRILNKREKYFFFSALALFSFSVIFLLANLYFENTKISPKVGGDYTEGVIGQPRMINPIFAPANDTDRDLSELIFSGLLKYDYQGKLVLDLAKDYQTLEEGRAFEFNLKEDLAWQDGKPLTADDIIFTIKTIQNPDYKSPLRPSWLGVEVEKISGTKIRFTLKNPSAIFLENTTLKILPKHIWQNIDQNNFPLSVFNLKPVGSGPYKIKKINQDKEGKITSLTLARNPYSIEEPNLEKITFKFFETENDLMKAAQNKEIEGFSLTDFTNATKIATYANLYSFSLPRYFAVFFNPEKQKIFADQKIIQALNYGTDKKGIIEQILGGKGKIVDSPVLPDIYGFNPPKIIYQFDINAAKDLLEKTGFQEGNQGIREKIVKKEIPFQFKSNLKLGSQGTEVTELQKCLARDEEIYPNGEITGSFGQKTKEAVIKFQEKYRADILTPSGLAQGTGEILGATRKKLNEICFPATEQKIPLSFTLITPNQPQLIKVAELLKNQWKAIGVEIEIKTVDIGTLEREIIKTRDYDAILFGEILGAIPDPFPFWHSSQKKDPGLNLAIYEDSKADKLLEEARQTSDEKARKEKLESFQELFLAKIPVVLLYNPDYIYFASKKIKGINTGIIVDPSKRFSEISNWYTETKRAWK
ncbi:MAG: ABC transporter substrate-binding protein [bacterium]|nr:ABC transporter substrate-binding protein [bacterium]